MTFAFWMVLVAGIIPYVTVVIAKAGPGFDNARPRQWLDQQSGFRQRADWAHRNGFETFPFFAAGVIIAEITHASQAAINWLAGIYVLLRIVYTLCYLYDQATLRSAVWFLAMACAVALYCIGA